MGAVSAAGLRGNDGMMLLLNLSFKSGRGTMQRIQLACYLQPRHVITGLNLLVCRRGLAGLVLSVSCFLLATLCASRPFMRLAVRQVAEEPIHEVQHTPNTI